MYKEKCKKVVIGFVCVLLLLVGLFFEYRKYQVKPFSCILPLSCDEVIEADMRYSDGWVTLDLQQVTELFDILDNCSVKFWSASTRGLSDFYADAVLCTDDPFSNGYVDIMFSADGRVTITPQRSNYLTVYKFVDGGDAVYQYLRKIREEDKGTVL